MNGSTILRMRIRVHGFEKQAGLEALQLPRSSLNERL
jgi:hypothetical protein